MLIASVGKRLSCLATLLLLHFRLFCALSSVHVGSLFESVVCLFAWKCLWIFAGQVACALLLVPFTHFILLNPFFFRCFSLMFATVFLPHCSMVSVRLR